MSRTNALARECRRDRPIGRYSSEGRGVRLPSPDRLLPPAWPHRAAATARGAIRVSARGRSSARYFPARSRTRRKETPSTNRLSRAVLLTDAVFSVLSNVSALRLQGLSHRSPALFRWRPSPRHDRQHARGGAAGNRARDGSRARDGGFCRALRLPLRGPRAWRCQPFRPRGTTVISIVLGYAQSVVSLGLSTRVLASSALHNLCLFVRLSAWQQAGPVH